MKTILFLLFIITFNANAKTFVIDFDTVFYSPADHISYLETIYRSAFKNTKYDKTEIKNWIEQHNKKLKNENNIVIFLEDFNKKFNIYLKKDDIKVAVNKMPIAPESMKEILKTIIKNGDKIIVIGGGKFGCGVLVDYLEQFDISADSIYSGYFKNLSNTEIAKALLSKYKYYNCGDLTIELPNTTDKNVILDSLNLKNIVKIGDFNGGPELWQIKANDLYSGFGIK